MNWELLGLILTWLFMSYALIKITLGMIIYNILMTPLQRKLNTLVLGKEWGILIVAGIILGVYYYG